MLFFSAFWRSAAIFWSQSIGRISFRFCRGCMAAIAASGMTLAIQPTRTEPAASALNDHEAKMAMHDGVPSYGSLVIINSAVFILFCVQLLQAPDEAGLALHPQY